MSFDDISQIAAPFTASRALPRPRRNGRLFHNELEQWWHDTFCNRTDGLYMTLTRDLDALSSKG